MRPVLQTTTSITDPNLAGAARPSTPRRALLIAHRGYSGVAPENTLPAFKLALDCGVDMVELDFRVSKDGVPVVIHDAWLDRTTNARRLWKGKRIPVNQRTVAELQKLDAGSWYDAKYAGTTVPLLSEALEVILPRGAALVEHKAGTVEDFLRFLRQTSFKDRVVVQSFNWEFLRRLREHEPGLPTAALGPPFRLAHGGKPLHISRRLSRAWLRQAGQTGAQVVVWNWRVSPRAAEYAHELGFGLWIYTINRRRPAQRLLRAGVDGLITNEPELIRREIGPP